jgi:hypothetical protein
MMLQPLRNNAKRQRVVNVKSVPAPVGGWNARDGIADMDAKDAIRLDNYFPSGEGVSLRKGSERFVTLDGVSTAPETLMVYASGATNKMLACADGAIYDASTTGTVSATLETGLSNDRWSYENMGGYIVFVNGSDTPRKYDGSAVSTTTITGSGLTATDLIYVCQSKQRLFFIEKNTLNAWYLATAAIAGSASKLDFSGYCKLGGKLVAIGTWTRDGGSGSDDFVVFLTDKGEALIYEGTDPSDATKWSLVGVFRIGEPIGSRPFLNVGADLIVITNDGFIPLAKVLPVDRAAAEQLAISDKIRNAVNTAAKTNGSKFGWQAVFYAGANWGLFNIPTTEGSAAEQYVMNTITGAWCKFKGMKAVCWAIFNKELYFGAPGGFVVKADVSGNKDDTLATVQAFANIQGDIRPAFGYFGGKTTQKTFKMVRPVLKSTAAIELALAMDVDFSDLSPQTVSTPAVSGTPWGSPWSSPWGGSNVIRKDWVTISGIGYSGSLHLRTSTQGVAITLNSIDYAYQNGGIL